MKNLIIKVLHDFHKKILKARPTTQLASREINISDVMPIELPKFMADNNIPDDADFDGEDNGYDGWYPGTILLTWNETVPSTPSFRRDYVKRRFNSSHFRLVYKMLTDNGYKRISSYSNLFKEFDDTTVYDMFKNNDFDRLVKYFSLFFVKDDE